MINTRDLRIDECLADHGRSDISDQISTRWSSNLIVDNVELIAICCEAQPRFSEIVSSCAVDPRSTHDQVFAACRSNGLLPHQLGHAVVIDGRNNIAFLPGHRASTVEHVIRGIVSKPTTQLRGFFRDSLYQILIGFGPVHRSIGGSIDDDVWRNSLDGCPQAGHIGEITA
ncbi:hypothetical protein D3C84_394610 [compost metagenome]